MNASHSKVYLELHRSNVTSAAEASSRGSVVDMMLSCERRVNGCGGGGRRNGRVVEARVGSSISYHAVTMGRMQSCLIESDEWQVPLQENRDLLIE